MIYELIANLKSNALSVDLTDSQRTFPVLFINSSRLSSGLGAPLSSYLEGALYKLI